MSGGPYYGGWGREPSATEATLLRDYQNIRQDIAEIEELTGSGQTDLTEAELKQLDKAVVLMRVGSKMLKKILRQRGCKGNLKPPVRAAIKA